MPQETPVILSVYAGRAGTVLSESSAPGLAVSVCPRLLTPGQGGGRCRGAGEDRRPVTVAGSRGSLRAFSEPEAKAGRLWLPAWLGEGLRPRSPADEGFREECRSEDSRNCPFLLLV